MAGTDGTERLPSYEVSIMREQTEKFNRLKHIALGEHICGDSLSLGKSGDVFEWHDAETGIKLSTEEPIRKLLDRLVVGTSFRCNKDFHEALGPEDT